MQDKNFLNNLIENLCAALPTKLPANLKEIKKDIEQNFGIILNNTFNKLDLVTRKEFDTQTKVLARSRQKIEALETKVAELEKIITERSL